MAAEMIACGDALKVEHETSVDAVNEGAAIDGDVVEASALMEKSAVACSVVESDIAEEKAAEAIVTETPPLQLFGASESVMDETVLPVADKENVSPAVVEKMSATLEEVEKASSVEVGDRARSIMAVCPHWRSQRRPTSSARWCPSCVTR